MKIGFARIHTKNNNFQYNFDNIEKLYKEAESKELEVVIFPRFALSGFAKNTKEYLNFDFIKNIDKFLEKVIDLTYKKKCKILIGDIYFEPEYEKNKIKYEKKILDSAFFINNGKIDNIISRKYFSKENPLNDIQFFDKSNFISFFEYNKKKITVLLSDDIFLNFNILLASEQKPDYIICLDSSIKDIEFKKKHLIKLAKFSNCPLFYINSSNYINENLQFNGEIILIDEEFKVNFCDFYKNNSIFDFFIDYEDGSEIFIKNNYEINNNNNIYTLKEEYENKILNIDCSLYTYEYLQNIQNNIKNVNFIQFSDDTNNYIKIKTMKINLGDFIDNNFYDKLEKEEKQIFKKIILEKIK